MIISNRCALLFEIPRAPLGHLTRTLFRALYSSDYFERSINGGKTMLSIKSCSFGLI